MCNWTREGNPPPAPRGSDLNGTNNNPPTGNGTQGERTAQSVGPSARPGERAAWMIWSVRQ